MKSIKLLFTAMVCVCFLASCSVTKGWMSKRDNGSLDYQRSELLAPIELPANQAAQPFTKIYPTIDLGESTVNTVNESGKQFKLPAPPRN